jgi:UDP:flavonoid glycosyltransferase YjiC (YdhE family)
MAAQMTSGGGEPIPESIVQQSMLQQARAAAAAENDSARAVRQDAILQTTDLITPDPAEDDTSPPAYGDVFGEIRNEKEGLGTSASVGDDGRVNIRINQLNRRLSQLFTPALSQHVQSAQDSQPPPPPYIPPSLGGEEGVPPPPPLSIVIQVVGSRGDVQPFVALGKVLKDTYGHRVRLATHPNFRKFVQEENGLEFFNIGGDPSQLMAFMVKNPGLMPGLRSIRSGDVGQRRKDVAEYIQGCWRSCYQAGNGMTNDDFTEPSGSEPEARAFVADCIIANPPSFAHIHCAEKLGVPLHIMFTMPYSPTQAFPHPLANIQSSNADPQLTNYLSYAMIEALSWQGLGDIINRFRKKCLGLDPVSVIWAPGMLQRLKIPHTYCWSPALIPKPKDWGSHISISGFYFLNLASNYTPAPDLQAFLDAGPPPVYIGFGSIVLDDPNAMTELIFEATKKTGQRVLLSKGWGGMGADELQARTPDSVFMLGNVPHDWLFKRVSCVVHHGGAGTTAAGISAGK